MKKFLPSDNLSEWQIDSTKTQATQWHLTPNGFLCQLNETSRATYAKAARIIHNQPIGGTASKISLKMKPSLTYQSGLVFNFVDHKNFWLVTTQPKQNSESTETQAKTESEENPEPSEGLNPETSQALLEQGAQAFDIVVGKVVANESFKAFKRISYKKLPPVLLTLHVEKAQSTLLVKIDEKLICQFQDTSFTPESKVGLFCRDSKDAEFRELIIEEESLPLQMELDKEPQETAESIAPAPESPTTSTSQPEPSKAQEDTVAEEKDKAFLVEQAKHLLKEANVPLEALQTPDELPDPSSIKDYTRLAPPQGKYLASFDELYRVSLDSYYVHLYLNPVLNPEPPEDTSSQTDEDENTLCGYEVLDYRPNRWYREYKDLQDAIKMAHHDLQRAKKILNHFENGGSYPNSKLIASNPAAIYQRDEEIQEAREEFFTAQDAMEFLQAKKNELKLNMRKDGYLVRKDNVPTNLKNLGFNFVLVRIRGSYSDFHPVYVPPSADLLKDATWAKIESKLSKSLLKNPGFYAKKQYQREAAALKSYQTARALAEPYVSWFRHEIRVKHHHIQDLQKKIHHSRHEFKLWDQDWHHLNNTLWHIHYNGHWGHDHESRFRTWLNWRPRMHRMVYSYHNHHHDHYWLRYPWYYRLVLGSDWWREWRKVHTEHIKITRKKQGKKGTKTIRKTEYRTHIETNRDSFDFFHTGKRICEAHRRDRENQIHHLESQVNQTRNQIHLLHQKISNVILTKIRDFREQFMDRWNNPGVINTIGTGGRVMPLSSDPLLDLTTNLKSKQQDDFRVYRVQFKEDGYYTQDGVKIHDFINIFDQLPHVPIVVVPEFEENGREKRGVWRALINPIVERKINRLPRISFVEYHETKITWRGFALGELSESVSLFPGETKELVVEKSTRQSKQQQRKSSSEREFSSDQTTSFEDELQNQLEQKMASDRLDSSESSSGTSQSSKTGQERSSSSEKEFNANMSGGFGGSTASAEASSTSRQEEASKKSNAEKINQERKGKVSNKDARQAATKSTANLIQKSASKTSMKNKVSFSSVGSSQYETSESRKEVIKIQNPNVGRTVNYNFFQLQNIYETINTLVDIKIVVDPGINLFRHSHLSDKRVFELEEFGQIFERMDSKDPRSVLLSAIIFRQVAKNYLSLKEEITRPKPLFYADAIPFDKAIFEKLSLADDWGSQIEQEGPSKTQEMTQDESKQREQLQKTRDWYERTLFAPLKEALNYVKDKSFIFEQAEGKPVIGTVNSGSFYMDAETSYHEATEEYLEESRKIELEKQEVELAYKSAQTQQGVFYPEIPDSVTQLSMNVKNSPHPQGSPHGAAGQSPPQALKGIPLAQEGLELEDGVYNVVVLSELPNYFGHNLTLICEQGEHTYYDVHWEEARSEFRVYPLQKRTFQRIYHKKDPRAVLVESVDLSKVKKHWQDLVAKHGEGEEGVAMPYEKLENLCVSEACRSYAAGGLSFEEGSTTFHGKPWVFPADLNAFLIHRSQAR